MSVVVYDVNSEGELVALTGISRDVLSSDRVVIVVAERQRKIYLWKGKTSSVKKKFVGARKASDLRNEWGLTFKVVALDEGEEDGDFLSLLGAKVDVPHKPSPPGAAVQEEVKEAPAVRKDRVKVEEEPAVQPAARVSQPAAQPPPVRVVSYSAPAVQPAARVSQPAAQPSRSAPAVHGSRGVVVEVDEDEVLSKLNAIEVPKGYVREIVVVGPCIYAVKETRTSIFGKESVERRLEKVNPPEGIFVVENFLPRVIAEGGRIVAIEFLRERSKDEEVEPLKSEMVKHLEDIISVFKGGGE